MFRSQDKRKNNVSDHTAALREALERIADPRNTHFAGDAQVVAREALAAQPQQSAGWRLVPVEPTQEWIDAAGEKGLRIGSIRSLISDVLACAPAHPSQQEDDARDAVRWRAFRERDRFENFDYTNFQDQFREDADRIVDTAMTAAQDAAQGGWNG